MSRDKILTAIRKNKPEAQAPPELPDFRRADVDLEKIFREMVVAMGGKFLQLTEKQPIETLIAEHFPNEINIASAMPGLPGSINLTKIRYPAQLEGVGLAILPAQFGVAENGAVWLTETDCGHRALPFIAQHLVVVLKKENLVQNMHEAYQRIRLDGMGFGAFIAGPSKTADIEQSLVIGAQGARSLTVMLY
ncbi:MAG: LUD domain-containing protein [Lewinellaceae bacterium]|nr:LUD domain-containing protein [Saprospiraceae bacterium]MCB9336859.1 LUD domain-containing protein [Lewinellaceae bacterium]